MASPIWALERAGFAGARAASAGGAAERREPRRLELADGEVLVYAPDGDLIQSIPFDPDALTEFNREFFMTTPDINFDGWPDLLLIASQGLQNVFYDGWLWDPDADRYVYAPEIRALASPVFDGKARRITTFDHGSATDHVSGVWEWRNGRLTEIRREEQSYDDATGLFTIRIFEAGPDGRLALTRTETLTQAQLESR